MYRRLVQRIGHHRWFAALLRTAGAPLDRLLYRASAGRVVITGPVLFPTLLLTTTGRRSGKPRTTPLIYRRDGSRLVVSSENFGQRRPAAWPLNLLADPHATVQLGALPRPSPPGRPPPTRPTATGRSWLRCGRRTPPTSAAAARVTCSC